jgi:hypothetical protein
MKPVRFFAALAICLFTLTGFSETRVRKHVCDLTQPEWTALDHAFQKLEALPDTEADNYIRWAQIHGYAAPVSTGPCKHNSEQVWTWHRAYLIWFENALRASDPPVTANVTIPYWDWTQPPTGARYPVQFETMKGLLPVGSDCPVVSACRDTTPHPGSPFDPKTIASIQAIPDWTIYGGEAGRPGALESQPHNTIHGSYIGGLNSNNREAARDPLFWAHHSNLDRLWAEFQAAARTSVPPREPGPVNKTFKINFRKGMPHELSGDYADISSPWLDYRYQPQQNQCPGQGLAAAAMKKGGRTALLKIAMPKAAHVVEVPFNIASMAAAERVLLRFAGVTKPVDASYVVRVYLRPAGSDPATRTETEQLTFFTVWRSNHDHEHGDDEEPTLDITLDVTDRLRELTAGTPAAKRVVQIDIERVDDRENFQGIELGPEFNWRNLSIEKVTPLPQTIR